MTTLEAQLAALPADFQKTLAECGFNATRLIELAKPLQNGVAADNLVKGKITGKVGDKFVAGKLGEKKVIADGEGTQVMLGDPFKFDAKNIGEWKSVY